jgi:membrane-bound metal-dependent hydrolase YbcI (DUF457 family)
MGPRMPSPIGHALAGIVVAWSADLYPGGHTRRPVSDTESLYLRAGGALTLTCAALAAAPDLDLAFTVHRTVTHSVGAVVAVGLCAAAASACLGRPIARTALTCAVAYGSHLLLDWLGVDRYPPIGIQALWPLNHEWYISGLDIFRQTARQRIFTRPIMLVNAKAVAQEIAILAPIAVALWLVRVKALARFAPEMARGHHPPQ